MFQHEYAFRSFYIIWIIQLRAPFEQNLPISNQVANLIQVKTSSWSIKYIFIKILRHGMSGTRGTYALETYWGHRLSLSRFIIHSRITALPQHSLTLKGNSVLCTGCLPTAARFKKKTITNTASITHVTTFPSTRSVPILLIRNVMMHIMTPVKIKHIVHY